MPDTLYLADPGDEEESSFARFVSLLGIAPENSGTFSVAERADLPAAWNLWIEQWFRPVLASAFIESYFCALESRIEEVKAIDAALDAKLTDILRSRSHLAAAAFFEGKSEMKGNRAWVRFSESVEQGETPGNLAVVFAMQSALFHLPLSQALSAYAWFEFQCRRGTGIPALATEEENETFAAILPHVAVAVAGKIDDSGSESGDLRII